MRLSAICERRRRRRRRRQMRGQSWQSWQLKRRIHLAAIPLVDYLPVDVSHKRLLLRQARQPVTKVAYGLLEAGRPAGRPRPVDDIVAEAAHEPIALAEPQPTRTEDGRLRVGRQARSCRIQRHTPISPQCDAAVSNGHRLTQEA